MFYGGGDASRMAKDVDQALRTIAQEEGSMSQEDASVWVKNLQGKALPKGCLLGGGFGSKSGGGVGGASGGLPGFQGTSLGKYLFLFSRACRRIMSIGEPLRSKLIIPGSIVHR